MDNKTESNGLLFANRCKSIPVFNSTCYWLNEYYNRIKDINILTKCTVKLAETTIKTSIYLANPLIEKFKDQVQTLDTLACQQLDKLEAAFPILLEDTTKVVNVGKDFLTKTVQPVEDKYLAIKSYSLSKVESIKGSKSNSNKLVKKILDLSERFIETHFLDDDTKYLIDDKILHYCFQQANMSTLLQFNSSSKTNKILISSEIDLSKRAKILTCILYCAMQRKCLKQINYLMHSLDAYLERLNKLIDLLEQQKSNFKMQCQEKISYTKQKLSFYKEYLELLSKQLIVQDGRSLDHVHSVEERTIILIRRSLGNLLTALYLVYNRMNVIAMNYSLHEKYLKVMERIMNIYKYFQKMGNLNGLSEKFLIDYRMHIYNIQKSLFNFLTKISNLSVVNWMTPNFEIFGVINCFDNDEDDTPESINVNETILNNENNSLSEIKTPKIEESNKSLTEITININNQKDDSILSDKLNTSNIDENNQSQTSSSLSSSDDKEEKLTSSENTENTAEYEDADNCTKVTNSTSTLDSSMEKQSDSSTSSANNNSTSSELDNSIKDEKQEEVNSESNKSETEQTMNNSEDNEVEKDEEVEKSDSCSDTEDKISSILSNEDDDSK